MSTLVTESKIRGGTGEETSRYQPALWEKICLIVAGFSALILIGWLLHRDRPLHETLAGLAYVFASLAAAAMAASLPGYLDVGFSRKGLMIRGGGALAVFLVTLFALWQMLPTEKEETEFRVIDAATKDPVYRALDVHYESNGEKKKKHVDLNDAGKVTLEGTREQIKIKGVSLSETPQQSDGSRPVGYLYDLTANPKSNEISLKRTSDFIEAIAPPNSTQTLLPVPLYPETLVEMDWKEVEWECINNSKHEVTLIAYRVPDPLAVPRSDDAQQWQVPMKCPPGTTLTVKPPGGLPHGYFAIYASVFGLEATLKDRGYMCLTKKTRLLINMKDYDPDPDSFKVEIEVDRRT